MALPINIDELLHGNTVEWNWDAYYPQKFNQKPSPILETDENNTYFLCILPIHPLTNSILGQENDLSRDIDKSMVFSSLNEIDKHLRSQKTFKRDQVEPKLLELLESIYLKVLSYCEQPQSRLAIFENLALYNNSRNFDNYIKPLLEIGWLKQTIPDKPTSKNQQYVTTTFGNNLVCALTMKRMHTIERIQVASSNIASVGYDAVNKILEIEFHHGTIYQYLDVPKKVFEELMGSPAMGSYFMNEIKSRFKHQQK